MLPLSVLNSVKERGSNGALRSHLFAKRRTRRGRSQRRLSEGGTLNYQLSASIRAAENSHRQGPEVSPSRQACDFETVTGLTM
jgi:hypothetical protein